MFVRLIEALLAPSLTPFLSSSVAITVYRSSLYIPTCMALLLLRCQPCIRWKRGAGQGTSSFCPWALALAASLQSAHVSLGTTTVSWMPLL